MNKKNNENNQDIEKYETSKCWWKKLLGLNPTSRNWDIESKLAKVA